MTSPSNRVFTSRVSPRIVIAVTLLPEPDSPTIPSTWPRSSVKSTPSTARTMPSSVANWTFRPLTSRSRSAIALGGPDPRVEPGVDEVDQSAEDDDEERAVERHPHDRREVEAPHRLTRGPADTLQVEDRLGQDRPAAEHGGEVETEQRHERDQRVAQHVLPQD